MSNPIIQNVPVLLGVAVGALATYFTTSLTERTRWRREQATRWDKSRMRIYAEYGNAVKNLGYLSARVAAGRGFPRNVDPIAPDEEAMKALNDAEDTRGRIWESVLLLGNSETVEAAREWHQTIWRMLWYARGWLTDAVEYIPAKLATDRARDRFYECARRDLGVLDQKLPTSTPPKWLIDWRAGRDAASDAVNQLENQSS